jgi:endonuclease-3
VEKVKQKWYSFLQMGDSVEDQRFQLLVAARLHARCQDKAVHQAMIELRKALHPMSFSAETVARADPNQLQECISNLQFYSVKAKQIVQAANEIVDQYSGQVPESESSLMKVTGIGPVFADLLATINTRAEHQKRRGDLYWYR